MEEIDLDKMVSDLILDAKLKNAFEESFALAFCAYLLRGIKQRPDLKEVIHKKVNDTLKELHIYKDYINKLKQEN